MENNKLERMTKVKKEWEDLGREYELFYQSSEPKAFFINFDFRGPAEYHSDDRFRPLNRERGWNINNVTDSRLDEIEEALNLAEEQLKKIYDLLAIK
ncbi:MAG: hypothetical protein ACFE8J_08795 [Candidatus Heimdallarchaeota archaeon]